MGEIALGDPPRWKRLGNSLCANLLVLVEPFSSNGGARTNPSRPYANASLAFLRQNGVHRFPLSTLSRASAFLSSLRPPFPTHRTRDAPRWFYTERAFVISRVFFFFFLSFFLLLPSSLLFCSFEKTNSNVLRGPRNETRSGEREREREIVATSSRKEEKIRTSAGERMKPYLRSRIRRNLIILGYFFIFIERDDSRYFIIKIKRSLMLNYRSLCDRKEKK